MLSIPISGQAEKETIAIPHGLGDKDLSNSKDLNNLFSPSTSEAGEFPEFMNNPKEFSSWNSETKGTPDSSPGGAVNAHAQPSGQSSGPPITASLQALLEESDDEDFISNEPLTEEVPGLPDGWVEQRDSNTGYPFYVHAASGKSQWERPQSTKMEYNSLQTDTRQMVSILTNFFFKTANNGLSLQFIIGWVCWLSKLIAECASRR